MVALVCGDEASHTRNHLNGRSLGQFIKVTLCHLSALSLPSFPIFAFFGCPLGDISRLDLETLWSFQFISRPHFPIALVIQPDLLMALRHFHLQHSSSFFLQYSRTVLDFHSHVPILSRSIHDAFHHHFRYTHFSKPGLFFVDLVMENNLLPKRKNIVCILKYVSIHIHYSPD